MSLRTIFSRLSPTLRAAPRLAQFQSHLALRTMATSIPKTMKGVQISKVGGSEVLEYKTDLPVPEPKEGEVLVKNDFIGINYIDTYFRTGLYPSPLPQILGREAEGHIVATGTGNLFNLHPGDRVVWCGEKGYAEYSAVPAAKTYAVPSGIEPGVAAAAFLQGITALTFIREAYPVKKGEWVLVHAAAGGVGLWMCQLLKAVGARTIGTASTKEKLDLARENGAEVVVNYKEEGDFVGRIMEITGGEGVHVVFDSTGKDQFENDLKVVRRKGSVISYGNSSGPVPPFEISRLAAKNLKIMRPTLFNYIATREEFEKYSGELFDFIIKDKLNARIHETYPLTEVARAHNDLEGRKTTGKLLLKP